jgi:hypothetical protein
MKSDLLLKLVLRWVGGVSMLALIAVAMPYSWMDVTHQWLGLGKLPEQPIVGYLARSLSAFYALLGGLMWVASFDLARHRLVICYLGLATAVFGVMLFFIDWAEGLPPAWRALEGPWCAAIGAVILLLVWSAVPPGVKPKP